MEKQSGKYYSRFKDESWEQALLRKNAFDSLLDAVKESLLNKTNTYHFIISDYEGNILFDSANQEKEHLKALAFVKSSNRFYIKADYDSSLAQAILEDSNGFASEQDAIEDMKNQNEDSRDLVVYSVYHLNNDLKFEKVYVGQVGNL